MAEILDGKGFAEKIRLSLKKEIEKMEKKPCLAAVLVGEDPGSKIYVGIKERACNEVGILSKTYKLPEETKQDKLFNLIDMLNNDENTHGILVQMPLPKQISENIVIEKISPEKDVDGLQPVNLGKLFQGNPPLLVPCTPKGIMKLLDHYQISVAGKNVVIINRSKLVGRPLYAMMINADATVTTCHSKTKNLEEETKKADILVTAVGRRPSFMITKEMIKENAVIIDVGINRIEGKLYGDVDFENVKNKASYITPVPGGVGPMTVAMLLENTLIATKNILP